MSTNGDEVTVEVVLDLNIHYVEREEALGKVHELV